MEAMKRLFFLVKKVILYPAFQIVVFPRNGQLHQMLPIQQTPHIL